jgi:hypothetical protein
MSQSKSPQYDVGFGKPPSKSKWKKGQSGNPQGRPKTPEGVSIAEILDGTQHGKNGEVISSREALVIRILHDAMRGDQRAFSKFLQLMTKSGLLRSEVRSEGGGVIFFRTDPKETPSPKTYAVWLRKEGKHDEADEIDPQL